MNTTLLALHGFTLNGTQMRAQMGALAEALGPHVDLLYPNGSHTCAPESVDRVLKLLGGVRTPPPHLSFWDATEDGRIYRGWERTREQMRELLAKHQPAGVLGFSQGAILAATLAALSAREELPELKFAVLIAGREPRAEVLQPLFQNPIRLPSLHIWGARDTTTVPHAAALAERFELESREVKVWPGPHTIPTRGPAADSIVDFVRRYSA